MKTMKLTNIIESIILIYTVLLERIMTVEVLEGGKEKVLMENGNGKDILFETQNTNKT